MEVEHCTNPMRNSDFDVFRAVEVPSRPMQSENVNV